MSPNQTTPAPVDIERQALELSRAFVGQKPSKRAEVKGIAIPETKDIDIRAWASQFRSALPKGELVQIHVGETIAAKIHKPLFKATSTKFEKLYQDGVVKLPADTDEAGVDRLIGYLNYVSRTAKKPRPMSNNMPMFDMLSVCTAGSLLGMDKYIDHVYKKAEAMLRADLPLYEDIDAVIFCQAGHSRLYKIVVQALAIRVRDATIPDPEDFEHYLANHPSLAVAIKESNDAYAKKQRKLAEAEDRKASWDKAQAARKDALQRKTLLWADKNEKRQALVQSCAAKSSGPTDKRKKFTAEERAHWISVHGKQPPKGC